MATTKRYRQSNLKTLTERMENNARLEHEYKLRRGKFINYIYYCKNRYVIPSEILNMEQKTNEELILKYQELSTYISNNKLIGNISAIKNA
jgi:hypothetical protein